MIDTESLPADSTFDDVLEAAGLLVAELQQRQLYITTVESCTGGALADAITSIPGASEVMKDAFVTYSNEAKVASGVPQATIDRFTVYSAETAAAMVRAGLERSVGADVAVGITGSLTRTDPANPGSVPGEVYVAIARSADLKAGSPSVRKLLVPPLDRPQAKLAIVHRVLQLAILAL